MRIYLQITGGMGITLDGTLELSELPRDIAVKAESMLDPKMLERVAAGPVNHLQTEVQCYRLGLLKDGEYLTVFDFNETQCTPEFLDVLGDLVSALKGKLAAAVR